MVARGKGFFGALDHATLAAVAPDEREDHRTRDRHGLEPASGRAEIAAGLEHLTQQVVGGQKRIGHVCSAFMARS